MKTLQLYINESLSQEIIELRNKLNKMDKSKIFDGNYNLDDSLDKEFYEILISLNKQNSSDITLSEEELKGLIKDNPSGQGKELTPIILIREKK